MQAAVPLNRVRFTMLDQNDVAWTQPEKLDYLNQAITAVCQLKPDAYNVVLTIPLVAGALQQLPTDAQNPTYPTGHTVFDVVANGAANAEAVQNCSRESITAANRAWYNGLQNPTFSEWAFDERNPRNFYVSPPNDGTGTAVVSFGAIHPRLTLETGGTAASTILIPDTYESALWAHICASCYAKNIKRQDIVKMESMMRLFIAYVTGRTAGIEKVRPQHQTPAGTENVDGKH